MSENRLSRTYASCNLYVHQIFGTFYVRRYEQFCTLIADSLRESYTVVCEWECCPHQPPGVGSWRPHLFIFGIMIDSGAKFYSAIPPSMPITLRSRSLNSNFYIKVFKEYV